MNGAAYRLRVYSLFACVLALFVFASSSSVGSAADTLPDRLSDEDFWALSQGLSEPGGFFRSDNLLSNEQYYPEILPDLAQRVSPGGVYLGVGPEQNFNYIVAIRPKMAFITDVRRGNLHTHLMYKALFELSSTRADFYSRLFTKKRPSGLDDDASAVELVYAFAEVSTDGDEEYDRNLQAIFDHLTKSPHRLPLADSDRDGIAYVYYNFYWFGPSITYNSSSGGRGRGSMTNYATLMTAADVDGTVKSFLGSEDAFQIVRTLHERNLIVPVVGNFAGPTALRAVGQYVRDHEAVVSAFYLSNVEQYLTRDGLWRHFCANVASMPLDETSTFIRSGRSGFGGRFGGLRNSLGLMQGETRACEAAY